MDFKLISPEKRLHPKAAILPEDCDGAKTDLWRPCGF
jgi:hypothetical protein